MGLLDVGYHWAVEPDGSRKLCRPVEVLGSHCLGYNHNSVATCLIGGSDPEGRPKDTFSAAQREAVLILHLDMEALFAGVGRKLELIGHTELNRYRGRHRARPCPALDMDALRAQLAAYRKDHPHR